jgi:hypothetical protein
MPLLLRLAVKARLKIFAAKNVSKDTKRKIIVTFIKITLFTITPGTGNNFLI